MSPTIIVFRLLLENAGETNKEKLADLELALRPVKTSSGEEEEEGSQIAKERTSTKDNSHYWICQLRNGVVRPMNLTKLTNKV
jgi:hypothetical protein